MGQKDTGEAMKRIGIFANVTREDMGHHVERLSGLLKARGVEVVLHEDLRPVCAGLDPFVSGSELTNQSELVVAMGGDGTLLRTAALTRGTDTPILGVNLGRLGFLAGAAPDTLDRSLDRLLTGSYEIEERLALEASVGDCGAFCLNEFVIERGTLARIIQLTSRIDGELVSGFWGNGLIVSTPTGSTSYSLSGGGPVLHPSLEAVVITPLCPHSLSQRPIVVPATQTIEIEVFAEHQDIILTADGQTVTTLEPNDRVTIRATSHPVRLVNLEGLSFYELLRTKLDWSLADPAAADADA